MIDENITLFASVRFIIRSKKLKVQSQSQVPYLVN